ncbi:MAG: lantibiotic biosynthesis protein [Actinomycetota bacterium]|nr:lantibiotic biosynthesis protein [Actinomycetota bacterium]
MTVARRPHPAHRVVAALAEQFPAASRSQITTLLLQLVAKGFLLSDLRPPTTAEDPLPWLVERLKDTPAAADTAAKAATVVDELSRYEAAPLGVDAAFLETTRMTLGSLDWADIPLHVDLRLDADVCLPPVVAHEVEASATALWRLSPQGRGMRHLRSYHVDFLEKYGTGRLVPLMEVTDPVSGIGVPAGYEGPPARQRQEASPAPVTEDQRRRSRVLHMLYAQALSSGSPEIEITDEILAELSSLDAEPFEVPDQLEIYAEIHSASLQDILAGRFELSIGANPGSYTAGASLSRFSGVLGAEAAARVTALQRDLPDLGAVRADLHYRPRASRSGNISRSTGWHRYRVVAGTYPHALDGPDDRTADLPLDDIYVGATVAGMYAWSQTLGRPITAIQTTMLNQRSQAPNPVRLLNDIAFEGKRLWAPFDWGSLIDAPYLPRLRYSRSVLWPRTWRLPARLSTAHTDPVAWCDEVRSWCTAQGVPRFVSSGLGDQRLPYDLESDFDLQMLHRGAGRNTVLTVQESLGGPDQCWLQEEEDSGRKHVAEGVFLLTGARAPKAPPALQRVLPTGRVMPPRPAELDCTSDPGGEWLYAKLYVEPGQQDSLLTDQIADICRAACTAGRTDRWFFIRYQDPDAHLRLRLHGDPRVLYGDVLPLLTDMVSQQRARRTVREMTLAPYDPEIERYGGAEVMESAERVFQTDSEVVLRVLEATRQGASDLTLVEAAAVGVVRLLTAFGGADQAGAWLMRTGTVQEYRDEFRRFRRRLVPAVAGADGHWRGADRSPHPLEPLFALSGQALRDYATALDRAAADDAPVVERGAIAASLVHMHCNRLLGTDRDAEAQALAFARHCLEAIASRGKAELCV